MSVVFWTTILNLASWNNLRSFFHVHLVRIKLFSLYTAIFYIFIKVVFHGRNMSSIVLIPIGASTQNRFTCWTELKFILWKNRMIVWNENRILECIFQRPSVFIEQLNLCVYLVTSHGRSTLNTLFAHDYLLQCSHHPGM